MDLQGSLVNTNLLIYPPNKLINYLKAIPIDDNVPTNIVKYVKGKDYEIKKKENEEDIKKVPVFLNSKDIENLNKIKATLQIDEAEGNKSEEETLAKDLESDISKNDITNIAPKSNEEANEYSKKLKDDSNEKTKVSKEDCSKNTKISKELCNEETKNKKNTQDDLHLTTSDVDWLYNHLQKLRSNNEKDVPYLFELLKEAEIRTPENVIIKRNPVLEARCVKLRAQQDAREYRKMTKSVDNVRMRFPEDSISYQLKQVNRQLIAIGQFIISIVAGFLFGFKGVEWTIGTLDFGFRLLLGVMCALIIALAEIYFLAKKLNEELNVPETVQLGGPPKFTDQQTYPPNVSNKAIDKEHKD